MPDAIFPPTLVAARERIAAIDPAAYAGSRNMLEGAVSRLSPYLTHGVVTTARVLADVAARHRLAIDHKLVFELGWREYFRHVWQHRGEGIFESLHEGLLPDDAYARELPQDIRQGRTGVPAIDAAVRSLYATGYLHNHARLWLASYIVHLRKVHWRCGADWLYGHLVDGDLASNHLSWQWVAGTGSSKPYLFNAENVARFAPAHWHSPRSVIDTSYEALDLLARRAAPVPAQPAAEGVEEPALFIEAPALLHAPPAAPLSTPGPSQPAAKPEDVRGRDVWLAHPWALGEPPRDLPANTFRLGFYSAEFHSRWAWSETRWAFVDQRMRTLTDTCLHADTATLAGLLGAARSVRTVADPHIGTALHAVAEVRPAERIFADVTRPCESFSRWWKEATRGVRNLHDLPGLAAIAAAPADPSDDFEVNTSQVQETQE